jgi:hypothetical protein
MNEIDLKTLLSVYQKKSFDLFTQTVALEAKNLSLSQMLESLNSEIEILKNDNLKLKTKKTSHSQKSNNSDNSGEF